LISRSKIVFLGLTIAFASPAWAKKAPKSMKHPANVPNDKTWVRSLDVDGGVWVEDRDQHGAQYFGVQTRYLDPDANAYVGLILRGTRFNDHITFGDPNEPFSANALLNWGAAIGMVRGRHTWEIDLMGANFGKHLAFGPALAGDHVLFKSVSLYHRSAFDFFIGDTLLDSDQGLRWRAGKFGISAGYRIFTGQHLRHSGPRIGIDLRFDAPHMAFIFPSIG
jgi:hypothetical protein